MKVKIIKITESVDGTLIALIQHCGQGLLTATKAKSMDQGKKKENTSIQETVWEL